MKQYNKLVRDNVANILKDKGYAIKGRKLQDEEYISKMYSLFWQEFNDSLNTSAKTIQLRYVEMLEIIRALMLKNGVKLSSAKDNTAQAVVWYSKLVNDDKKVKDTTSSFVQRFYELLSVKTEAIKDQLIDLFNSFKQMVEANNIDFAQVETKRRLQFDRFGGFNKGIYLEGVTLKKNLQFR